MQLRRTAAVTVIRRVEGLLKAACRRDASPRSQDGSGWQQ
jgi:hypothetical protein